MIWTALGEYRGPYRVHAFLQYARERRKRDAAELSYRAFVTDCVGALVGASRRWVDSVVPKEEIDTQSVIEHVISSGGLEVTG